MALSLWRQGAGYVRNVVKGVINAKLSPTARLFNQYRYCTGTKSNLEETGCKHSSDIKAISRFPVPEIESLPPDVKERIKEVAEKSGFIPNVFLALAHRPEEFRSFFSYYDALMMKESGSLTKAEKEMIVVATSAKNNCLYCVVAHGALLRLFSKNPLLGDQIAINWQHADLSKREKAILQFATKLGEGKPLLDIELENLKEHDLSEEDIWDIGAITAFFAMSNRLAHVTNMRPNDEFYLLGRIPKNKEK